MDSRKIGEVLFVLVMIISGAVAVQSTLVTDSTMLADLAIGIGAMGIDVY